MARQIQLRRGTTSQHSTFTGALGEVTVDTDKDVVVVHDGSTAGGFPAVKATSLATVATTGSYSDLSGTPSLATVATTGAYGDLSGTPSLATVATTGAYSDLSGLPTIPVVGTDALAYDANLQGFVDALTLPTSDGASGQALVTNGSGTISFGSAGISTGKAIAMAIVFG